MSKKAPSGVITLPRYLNPPRRRYVTRSGSMWGPETVALCFALTLRNHGTVEAVRATARRLVDKVCMEHQPNMKKLARGTDIPDDKTIPCALAIINRVCNLVGIRPDVEFLPNPEPEPVKLVEPPRCHFKVMRLAGYHKHRHWKCQHCSHTKPLRPEDIGK